MRLLSAPDDTSRFMSGEYETLVTAAPRPRKVRSSSGSTTAPVVVGNGDGGYEEGERGAPGRFLPPLRAVLPIDSRGGEPPALPVAVVGGGGGRGGGGVGSWGRVW